jgi:ribosomal protein S18 acetylase RimI-like enzyme
MIREANKGDCKNLATLSLQVWFETYAAEGIKTEYSAYALSAFTEQYFLSLLNKENYKILVSYDGTYLQGYALANLNSHYQGAENGFEIEKLYVHNKSKGKGVGRMLLTEIEKKYGGAFWLYTWVENKSNGFYKKLGFKHVGQYEFKFADALINNNVFTFSRTLT